jgi:hypothetical protein
LAIEKINDVNAELRRHIDPFTGLANHFQASDADKIEKFLNLLQGGVGTIFYDSKLFLTAVCALNLLRFEDILALYQVTEAELIGLLAKLDKIGFIELLPNNRIKLKVARTFAWIPNGPIMTTFKENTADFFDSDFSGSNQVMLLLNGRLNQANAAALVEKLRQLARDFSERHIEDSSLPVAQRESMSLLLACRPWHFSAMKEWSRSDNTKKKHKLH